MFALFALAAAAIGVFVVEVIAARRDRNRVADGKPMAPVAPPVTPYTDSYYAAAHVR